MPTIALRGIPAVLTTSLLLAICDVVCAQPTPVPATVEDQRLLPYAAPGQLVDIGGRRINLHCSGAGGPTVILMSGIASWSPVWYKTQPVIAQKTRVCARDRAGYGFSDPAPRPQILSEVVDDLHAALRTGAIPGPYVLVGHSLGGIEARLYAQRWPQEVVGMVLVDTSPAGEGFIDAAQPGFDEVIGREKLRGRQFAMRLAGRAWTPRAVEARIRRLLAAVTERHARCIQEHIPSFLHRLLCGRASLSHVVAVYTPI